MEVAIDTSISEKLLLKNFWGVRFFLWTFIMKVRVV